MTELKASQIRGVDKTETAESHRHPKNFVRFTKRIFVLYHDNVVIEINLKILRSSNAQVLIRISSLYLEFGSL